MTARLEQSPGLGTLAAAFLAAGYEAPEKAMMRRAIREGAGMEARVLAAFERLLPKSADAKLIRAIVGDEIFRSRVYKLWRDTYNEIRLEQQQGSASKAPSEKASSVMPRGQKASANSEAAPNAEAEARVSVPQGQIHCAKASAPPARSRVSYAGRGDIARESLLRQIKINGRALAEITAGEARSWLRTHDRHGHFVRLLIGPMADEMRFIDWYQDETEVERIWRKAQEQADAA